MKSLKYVPRIVSFVLRKHTFITEKFLLKMDKYTGSVSEVA